MNRGTCFCLGPMKTQHQILALLHKRIPTAAANGRTSTTLGVNNNNNSNNNHSQHESSNQNKPPAPPGQQPSISGLSFVPPPPPSISPNSEGNFRWVPKDGVKASTPTEILIASVKRLTPSEGQWYSMTTDVFDKLSSESKQTVKLLYKRIDQFFVDPFVRVHFELDEACIRVRRRPAREPAEKITTMQPAGNTTNSTCKATVGSAADRHSMLAMHFDISQQNISKTAKRRKRKRLEKKLGLAHVCELTGLVVTPK